MAQILVRQLDDDAKERLKERAERNGRSLEAEAREILEMRRRKHERTAKKVTPGFGTRIAGRFKGIGLTKSELAKFNRAIDKARKERVRFVKFKP